MGELIVRRGDVRVADPLVMRAGRWWTTLLLGLVTVLAGLVLVVVPRVAVGTLAILVAVGLISTGLGELAGVGRYRTVWTAIAGLIYIAAGVAAAVWPDITLWALALVAAAALFAGGGLRLMVALVDRPDGWGWLSLAGALAVAAGVVALVWPAATVLVLGAVLGICLMVYGATEIAFALVLRDIHHRTII